MKEYPIPPVDDRCTLALVLVDPVGITVHAVRDGVHYSSPGPLSERAAAEYLRILLPWLDGGAS